MSLLHLKYSFWKCQINDSRSQDRKWWSQGSKADFIMLGPQLVILPWQNPHSWEFLPYHPSDTSVLFSIMPRSVKSPKYQQGDRVPYVKAKSLCLYKFANLVSPHVQHIGINGEPQAQLELGFYSNKGGGEGFLRFRTSDWLTFV